MTTRRETHPEADYEVTYYEWAMEKWPDIESFPVPRASLEALLSYIEDLEDAVAIAPDVAALKAALKKDGDT